MGNIYTQKKIGDKRNNIKAAPFHFKIMTFYGVIAVLTRGEIWSSAFLIFLFEKNISEGFEVQDCIPEVKKLL